jgi:putative inorganic carbon (HCO3(-)) transporter
MDNNSRKENNLYRVYLIGFFLILALPVISSPVLLHPTAWGKGILFRIIISILIYLFIYQLLYKKTNTFVATATKVLSFRILVALFLIFLLATIFSLDPRFSFWGSPLRGDGFLNLGLIIIFSILIFLILKKSDWQKIWDFSILIGLLVSIIALFQKFNIFKSLIKSFDSRPPGTMGGPIFLGLYLLLLLFITFSFFLKEKDLKKRLFYFLASLLFVYIIFLTGSRAAYFGLFIGLAYFILTFPKKNKLIFTFKVLFIFLSLLGAYGIYYLNANNSIPGRLSIKMAIDDPRFSAWVISAEAIKDHPILGYGPENFSIAFDKYYSPSLPFISREWGSWYDRAHSFIFEIGVTAGIPALIIYILLFAIIFWQLQKKKEAKDSDSLIIHGIQTTFFAYLSANLFSFDVFSTYLIFFLIIAYSLSLIAPYKNNAIAQILHRADPIETELKPGKPLILSLLFIILISFIWFGCLKPLGINKEINWVDYYIRTDQCEKAIKKMEDDVLPVNSVINSYAKLKYVEVIENCNVKMAGLKKASALNVLSVLEEVKEIRPYYTRTWIFLGKYTNILIENKEIFKIKDVEELKKQADAYFEKATRLSPRREDIILGQIQNDIILGQYQSAREKTQECLNLNPESKYCQWLKIICNLYLGEIKNVHKDIEKGFNIVSETYLSQFKTICEETGNIECFKELTDILYSLMIYDEYRSSPDYHFYLVNISIQGEKEETLKNLIMDILGRFPELEAKLDGELGSSDKINKKMAEQYIINTKKIIKISNEIENLPAPKPIDFVTAEYKEMEEINKINEQIKIIK